MTGQLHLTIATPSRVLVDTPDVFSFRASDASGSFGILAGHAEFLTVIPASVVEWREHDGQWQYCTVRGGVLSVSEGRQIALACREGILGHDLASLEADVCEAGTADVEADKRARVEQTRLHAQAVRQLVRYLVPRGREAVLSTRIDAEI